MRLNDEINIPSEWKKELHSMEKHKMVLRRQRHVETNSGSQWYFRHDKIQEYFIVQTFLTGENKKLEQHINDPRFRGVYLLLATLLPYEKAWLLRDKLLQNAAETKDHVLRGKFIQRLNSRSELSKNGDNFNLLEIIKLLIVEKNININRTYAKTLDIVYGKYSDIAAALALRQRYNLLSDIAAALALRQRLTHKIILK